VKPLYKGKGSRKSPDSYRPISQIPPISRIFEHILFNEVSSKLDQMLSPFQHGFRKFRTAATLLTQFIHQNMDGRCSRVEVVYIDLKKAFNSVNHNQLLRKLKNNFLWVFPHPTLVSSGAFSKTGNSGS